MSDLESTVKALRHCAEYDCTTACPRSGVGEGCIRMLKQDAAAAIEELLALVPQWTPASTPPKENKNYLVYGTVWPLNVGGLDICRFDGERWLSLPGVTVTHWMPLPPHPDKDIHN